MTSARERPAAESGLRWDERSLLSDRAGLRWWMAIGLALVLTAAGIFADIQRQGRLGIVFQAGYFVGCLLAVMVVQRKGLFGPMVQPPLILALMVPGVVLVAGSAPTDGGTAAAALAVGTPLINGFPTMAVTTGLTLAVGFLRLFTQRPPATADDSPAAERTPAARSRTARTPAARTPAARTSAARTSDPDAEPDAEPSERPARSRSPEQPRTPPAEPMTEPVPRVPDQPPQPAQPQDDTERPRRRRRRS